MRNKIGWPLGILIMLLVLGVAFMGCTRVPVEKPTTAEVVDVVQEVSSSKFEILERVTMSGLTVIVFYDTTRDVTCWLSKGTTLRGIGTGISCLRGIR